MIDPPPGDQPPSGAQPPPGDQPPPDVKSPALDLRKVRRADRVHAEEISPYSETWANVVKPFTRAIFTLLAAVFLIPFLFVFVDEAGIRNTALDWAKTILAPIVGFASAAVGYYYGTRQGKETGERQEEEDQDEQD